MPHFQSYVICTSPRSGSTLLCKLLAATGTAGNPNSHFHRPSVQAWLQSFGLTPKDNASDSDILATVVKAAIKRGKADTDIFGLRLQRHSFDYFIEQMASLHPNLPNDRAHFQAAFGDTLFIHLSRENKIEQAVSCVKATQTGLWHMAADGTELERISPPKEPFYDADAISREIAELSAQDNDWKNWFAREDIVPLTLTYSQLAADPQGTTAIILERLGIDPKAAKETTPEVAKLSDATNRQWIKRFLAERGDPTVNT